MLEPAVSTRRASGLAPCPSAAAPRGRRRSGTGSGVNGSSLPGSMPPLLPAGQPVGGAAVEGDRAVRARSVSPRRSPQAARFLRRPRGAEAHVLGDGGLGAQQREPARRRRAALPGPVRAQAPAPEVVRAHGGGRQKTLRATGAGQSLRRPGRAGRGENGSVAGRGRRASSSTFVCVFSLAPKRGDQLLHESRTGGSGRELGSETARTKPLSPRGWSSSISALDVVGWPRPTDALWGVAAEAAPGSTVPSRSEGEEEQGRETSHVTFQTRRTGGLHGIGRIAPSLSCPRTLGARCEPRP